MPKPPTFPSDITQLDEARGWLRTHAAAGVFCPCCQQFVKIYRRKITSSMAYALLLIARHYKDRPLGEMGEWLHVPEYLSAQSKFGAPVRGGDWAKLRWWGLIEAAMDVEPSERRSDGSARVGHYRLTPLGRAWARGECAVPRIALIFNQRLARLDDTETVTIREALKDKFNYAELMGWADRGPA